MSIIKTIKFDLPLDGTKIKNLEELREHFTAEVLDLYYSGLLTRWLEARRLEEELVAIRAIQNSSDRFSLMKKLCEIFKVAADDLLIALTIGESPAKAEANFKEIKNSYKKKIHLELAPEYDQLVYEIDKSFYHLIRLNVISSNRYSYEIDEQHKKDYKKGESIGYSFSVYIAGRYESHITTSTKTHLHDAFGWYQCSKKLKDYKKHAYLFRSFQEQRIAMLRIVASNINIEIIQIKLNQRALLLEKLLGKIPESNFSHTQSFFTDLEKADFLNINKFDEDELELLFLEKPPITSSNTNTQSTIHSELKKATDSA
ncbi:hypothetical protein [uncultured Thiothrix sp.]|uniref:hypothetical protein n=1 Tax=uncultured Thiothrix sp. TaxID=223185 RepID=UPI0026327874|nr:hypothetical protein [uncultured Thiothrix sp.]